MEHPTGGGPPVQAAGGRSGNAHMDGLHAGGRAPRSGPQKAGSPSFHSSGVAAAFTTMGPTGAKPAASPSTPSQQYDGFGGGGGGGGEAFSLESVEAAAARDDESDELLSQLQELESQEELLEAAAIQLAREQGLSQQGYEALRTKMMERIFTAADELRATLAAKQQHGAPPPPGLGTLNGILSRASPRGVDRAELPNPVKGKGAYHPSNEMSGQWVGASSAAAGISEQRIKASMSTQFRLEHHVTRNPEGHRDLNNQSQITFGGNARTLYPHADVYHRGKPPGY